MAGVETVWELHTLTAIISCYYFVLSKSKAKPTLFFFFNNKFHFLVLPKNIYIVVDLAQCISTKFSLQCISVKYKDALGHTLETRIDTYTMALPDLSLLSTFLSVTPDLVEMQRSFISLVQ